MIYELIPAELHNQLNSFCQDLENMTLQRVESCPFCEKKEFYLIRTKPTNTYRCKSCNKYFNTATNTPFNRLTPFDWLEVIFGQRVQNQSYYFLTKKLECSLEKVMRRDRAIADYLKVHYLPLFNWYNNKQQSQITSVLAEQHNKVNQKIAELLSVEKPACLHCASNDTVKVGARTCYRCKRCRRSFNILSDTPLNRLPRTDLWQKFIDLLVVGNNNIQIEQALKLSSNTVSKWRLVWCEMMKKWDCEALAVWCRRH